MSVQCPHCAGEISLRLAGKAAAGQTVKFTIAPNSGGGFFLHTIGKVLQDLSVVLQGESKGVGIIERALLTNASFNDAGAVTFTVLMANITIPPKATRKAK